MSVDRQLLERICNEYEMPLDTVGALIYQESKGRQWATRYEPGWYERAMEWRTRSMLSGYAPPSHVCTLRTEKKLRATSFGYMQLLGESARSMMGFQGDYLIALCEPEVNLRTGVKFLAKLYKRNKGSWFKTLKQYNGSSKYPPLIFKHRESGIWEKIFE